MRTKIKSIYIDKAIGLVFITEEGREYAYKYFDNTSGAICDIDLVELPTKQNTNQSLRRRESENKT